jgi:hypothetical protein
VFYQTVSLGDISEIAAVPAIGIVFCGMLTDEQTSAVEYSLTSRVGSIQDGAQTGKTLRAIHQAISLTQSG